MRVGRLPVGEAEALLIFAPGGILGAVGVLHCSREEERWRSFWAEVKSSVSSSGTEVRVGRCESGFLLGTLSCLLLFWHLGVRG